MNSNGHSRTSRNGNRSAQALKPNRLTMALLATWGALPAAALAANNITLTERSPGVTDTATTITPRGGNPNVTDIRTTTVRGNSGFNSFGHFTVGDGNTVNLYVPGGANNLVNLVHLSAPTINGTLNGLLESSGKVGGNIFFASSHGFVVGGTGVVNVGGLLVTTPSSSRMQELLRVANGTDTVDNNQLVLDLLAGKYDGGSGAATIDGIVNSAGRVDLFAASATVASTGAVNAGARVFDATVNTDGSLDVSAAVRQDGGIRIVANDSVEVSGVLRALMADDGGAVVEVAGKAIELKGSASIDTGAALAGRDGGDVTLEARSIKLSDTSKVVTRAGGAGNAGDIVLNAYSDVSCTFCGGDAGDTQTIDDLADGLKTQASPLLQAKNGKAEVVIAAGAALDAGHDGGSGQAGDVTVQAFAFDRQLAGYAEATSSIKVDGRITGRDITLRAASDAYVSSDLLNNLLNTGGLASDLAALVQDLGEADAWAKVFQTLGESFDYGESGITAENLSLNPENYSELSVLLPYVSFIIAKANADVTIGAGAVLDASRNIDLQADSTRLVQASTFSLPFVNKKMPFNFGLAYGRIDGTTKVDVRSGAELIAGGDLDIRALSNDTLEVTATSVNNHDANGNTLTTMGIAFSMAHSDITTEATVAKGALLDVDGDVTVAALTEQELSNSAEFKAIGDGATGGPAIALTLFNSKTRAVFDADLSGATDLSVSATNLVHGQSNSSSVQVGKSALDHLKKQVMGSSQVKGVTDALTNKVKSLFGMKPSTDKDTTSTDSKFRLASALAIGISDHQAEAVIGSGNTAPVIDVTGNLSVQALQRQASMHNSADSTVNADADKDDGSKVSISIAAAYDQTSQQTRAIVGDGSRLTAARIGVGARNEQLLDLGDITKWSSMSDIFGNLKTIAGSLPDIPGEISTSYANSTSESEDFGLAGSVAVSYHALDATAWVGDGVSLTSTATDGGAWSSKPLLGLKPFYDDQGDPDEDREALRNLQWDWDASLAVQADTLVEQLSIAGNLWWTLFNVGADGDDGKAVGGGVNVQVVTNRSVAGIGANGSVESEAVDVSARQDELIIGISPSAGSGTSVAGNGAVVVGVVGSNVNASIHQSTAVTAGQVGVSASHDIGLWSAAGALAVSQETSIGIGVAVNVLTTDVQALVGNNNATDGDGDNRWRPDALGAGAAGSGNAGWNVDEVLVDAKSSGQSGAFGVAGALSRSEQEQEKQDEATSNDGGAGKGGTDLLSGEGVKLLGKFALAKLGLYDGLATAVEYGGKIKDALTETTDKVKGPLDGAGSAADKPENQIAGAGSASINVSGQNTRATVSGITIDPRTAGAGSDVTVLALNQTNQFSGAGAGALTLASGPKSDRSSAVAGAIAYNHLFNTTEALVDGVTFNDSDSLTVQAASGGDQIALGLGLAVSTGGNDNTAVGFSASGGAITNTTRAAVVDSQVNQRDDAGSAQTIEVSAYDRTRALLGGGAFAGTSGSGTSAGGSLVIGYFGNQLQAEWLGSRATGFDSFDVGAFSATRILAGAIAGAVSAGSDSTAGAGSMFVLIVDNEVTAKVDRSDATDHSSLEGGDVEVRASSVAGMGALDAQFDSAAAATLSASGLDLDGGSTVAGIEVEQSTDDSLFGGADDTSTTHSLFDGVPAGEAILGIAGSLSLSNGKAVGISAGGIYTGSDYTASVANTDVKLSGDLDVHARNSTEALAAAVSGALGNGDNAISGSIAAIIARGTVNATVDMGGRAPLEADDLRVTATKGGGAYSLAGNITGSAGAKSMGGAFSVNDLEQGTHAEVRGGSYQLGGDATIGAAQQSHVITAALSGSVSLSDLAIGGAGTFNRIADTTTAALSNAMLDARNLSVTASQPGLGAQIWSLAFNLAASGGGSGVGGAVAINLIDAERTAKVSGSTVNLSGDATLASSLDGEIWGFAVDVAGGSGNGVGGSIVVNNIDGSDTVLVENSNITTTAADGELRLDAAAGNGLMIASLTGSIKGGGSNAVGGAISVNRIGANRSALVRNGASNTISGFGDVSLLAGAQQDIYAIAVAGGGAGNVAVNGSSTSNILEGTERAAVEGGSIEAGSLRVSAAEGDRTIWSLGGAVSGAGSVAVGVANANNIILAKRQAEVRGAALTLDGALELESGGDAHIRSAAVGGGGAGSVAAGASVAINVIEGEESAVLADSTVHSAASVKVDVTRGEADIKTLAGNVQGAGAGAGAGAVAISTIGQKREARISGTTLDVGSGAVDVLAATHARIDTLAVSGAGAGTGAGAFSNTSNNIAARTQALVQNSGGDAGNVSVRASDDSEINAISGGVAVAGVAGAGVGTAINRIDSEIEAALTGTRGAGWNVTNLAIDADSSSDILSVAVGGGGGGVAGVGAAVATNLVTTRSKAHASDGAKVVAQHNIGISASNHDSILGIGAGIAGAGSAAVGASVTVNLIESQTSAYIAGSATEVSALGRSTSDRMTIDSGALLGAPGDGHDWFDQSRVEASHGDDEEWIGGDLFNPAPGLAIGQRSFTGLAVQASSVQQVGQLSLAAAVSVVPLGGASVAGLFNTSVLGGSTEAYIDSARINQAAGAGGAQDVHVGAASHGFSASYEASLGVSAGWAGIGAAVDVLVNQRETRARVNGATLDSVGATTVEAESTQYASSVVAAAGGGVVGAAAAAQLSILKGTTEAVVGGGSRLDVGSLSVDASALQVIAPNVATLAGGAGALGAGFGMVYNQSTTRAWVGEPLSAPGSALNTTIDAGAVDISAENTTRLQMLALGIAGGGAAVAGTATIAIVETVTEAGASQADFGSAGNRIDSLDISASDRLQASTTVGSAAVGGLSVGASANVLVANSATRALLDRSSVHANGDVGIDAQRTTDITMNTVTGSGGAGVALGGSIGLLVLGSGASTQVSEEGESFDPMGELNSGGNGTLSTLDGIGSGNRVEDITYEDYVYNSVTQQYERVERTDAASKNKLNASSKATAGDRLQASAPASYRHETVARVVDSTVVAGGDAGVTAADRLQSSNLAGNVAVGGLAGVGIGMGLTFSNAQVKAEVLGGSLRADDVTVSAQSLDLGTAPAVTVKAESGAAGGFVGAGAAVGVAVVDNRVNTTLGGHIDAAGTLTGRARDAQDIRVDALGANVGGAAGAGVVIGVAKHDSRVRLDVAPDAVLEAGNIDLASVSESAVSLVGRGGSGGILAGVNATILVARDDSDSRLTVGERAQVSADGALSLAAEARPHVDLYSEGVAIGGLLSAGGTIAVADVTSDAALDLRSGARLAARDASLASRIGLNAGRDSARVEGYGVSGGAGVAVNAVVATARNQSSSRLTSAGNVVFEGRGGQWDLVASTDTRQRAYTTGRAGGLITLGAHVADATAYATTEALVNGLFTGNFGGMGVSASASVDNQAEASAGQGGLVSGAASSASTRDDSTTRAELYARGFGGGAAALGDLRLSALHRSAFNAFVDSTSAAVLGMSGAWAKNTVDLDTYARLLGGSDVVATRYDQSARNEATKVASSKYNVQSGSGGVFDAAAASSSSELYLDAQSTIGDGARLALSGDWRAPEKLVVQAFNKVHARDRTKLDSGGAIAIADAESKIDVKQADATVSIGSGADLYSIGDLVLSASGHYDIDTSANAKTWGLAGAAMGESLSRVDANHDVRVAGGNSQLFAYGDLKLYSGFDAAGVMNKAILTARTDLWNNTAFPVVNDPVAVAEYIRDSNLILASGSNGRAVGDVHAWAGRGYSVLTAEGTGKDLYREGIGAALGLSLDIRSGDTNNGGLALVRADGILDSGIYHKQKLTVTGLRYFIDGVEVTDFSTVNAGTTGTLTVEPIVTDITEGVTYRVKSGEYSQLISARIAELRTRIANYGLSPIEKAAFQAELGLLERTLANIYAKLGGDPSNGVSLPNELKIWILEVDPIQARPGNIIVKADALTGSGTLSAPGDARIDILNQSQLFLDLKGLEIPDREGGQLLFNDARVASNAEITAANRFGLGAGFSSIQTALTSPAPAITVENTYNPATGIADSSGLKAPAPDILVSGRIFNRRGSIDLTAAYGSIRAEADIRGQSVNISAGQDFILTNMEGFTHIGGDPSSNNSGGQLTAPNSATVAGHNVVISALYLNINGLVQSGVADWSITINESDLASLDARRLAWKLGGPAVVQLVTTDARTGRIGYSYDFRSESLVLDQVEIGGGYMELTGHILSTGNGQLRVLDGYSQVRVVNNTIRDLSISGIDLGNGVEGQLKINDMGRMGDDRVWTTMYTYNNGKVQRYEGAHGQALGLVSETNGRSAQYDVTDGRTYVWLQGNDRTDTNTRVEYWDEFWGFIPTGDGTELSNRTVRGESTPIPGAEYMGSASNAYRIDFTAVQNEFLRLLGLDRFGDAIALLNAANQAHATGNASSPLLAPYLVWLNSPGAVMSQVNEPAFQTSAPEVIDRYNGGYCLKHFIWCQVYRTTRTTVTQTGLKEINRYTTLADSPIAINFIGYDAGRIDLTSNGNVTLLGSMFNDSGNTTVRVNQGSLTQAGDNIVSTAKVLDIAARDGIGDAAQALRVQAENALSAYSSHGDIDLQAVNGGVNLQRLQADRGDVTLLAQGDITSSNGATVIGRSIGLTSTHGSIGSAAALLNLDTGSNAQSLFSADAVGGVFVQETNGDLWVDRIRAGGDVHVKVRNGDLLDGNTQVAFEERSLDELRALWSSMGLTGADADAALAEQKQTLERAGQQRYARYWQMRNLRNVGGNWVFDAFDENQAQFSADQVAGMRALGWDDATIAARQAERTAEFRNLHAEFGGSAYDSGYAYALSASDLLALESTSHWTEDELRYSISASLLNRGHGGSSVIESINIEGRDVTLEANRIGRLLDDDVIIDLRLGPAGMTTEQRAALARAEYDDIYFDDDTNPTLIRIVQRDDVNVRASRDLRATANGDIYLGGDRDFNIYDVNGRTVQIKTDGSITSSNGDNVVLRGHDVVLEAAGGTIGGGATGDGALHTQVTGDLTARARVLDLVNHGDLSIQRLTGTDALRLRVLGNLSAATQLGENLLGGSVDLAVTGRAGSAASRIQIGTGGLADRINLDIGGDAWIGGLQGAGSQPGVLRIGSANVGGMLDIGQTTDLWQYGHWQVGGLVLDLNNLWRMMAGTSLQAEHGIFARVDGDAELAEVEAGGDGASIDIEAYRLLASHDGAQWRADGLLRLRAAGGDIGQASRPVTLGAERLDVASATGQLYLHLLGGILDGSLRSAGSQWLTSLGDVSLAEVDSGGGDVTLRGTGVVSIDTLGAHGRLDLQGQDLVLGSGESRTGDLLVDVSGSFIAGALRSGRDWTLDAATADIGGADIARDADLRVGDLRLGDLAVGGDWTLGAATADIGTADAAGDAHQTVGVLTQQQLTVGGDWTLDAGEADIVRATVQGDVRQQAGRLGMDTLAVGGNWQLAGGDAVIATADVGGSATQDVDTLQLGDLAVGGDWTLDATTADIGTADVAGDARQTVGALAQQQLTVGGDWTLDASEADIVRAAVQGDVRQQAGRLGMDTLTVGGNWQLTGGDAVVEQATVAGEVDVALAGDLSLGTLDARSTRIAAGNASRIGRLGIDGDLSLAVVNNLVLGRASVSHDAVLRHTGAAGQLAYGELVVGNTLDVAGAGDWTGGTATAGSDVRFDVGSADLQRLESLGGDLLLAAQRQFVAGALATPSGRIDLVAGNATIDAADAAGTLDVHVTGGPLRILHGHSGGNLTLTAEPGSLAEIHFGTPADPDAADGLATAHLKSGADILVRTDGDLYGGNAEAEGLVTLIGRNMRLGRVESLQGDVFLQAEQDIWGLRVEARGDVGIVAGGNLDMPDVRFGGTYSLKAGRDLTVGIGGDLNVRGVAEAGRDLTFNVGGNVDLAAVKAGRNVLVDAGGGIHLDEGVDAGGNVDLVARGGDISSGGVIRSSGQHEGQPTSGQIRLLASGDVDVAALQADAGDIAVDGRSLSIGSLLASGDIDLLGRGFIHVGSSRSGGSQDWRADGDIAFDELLAGAQAYLDSLLDTRGRLLSAAGGAVVNAGWRNGQASEATVWFDQVFAPTLSVHSGNRIHVGDANLGQAADLHGRDIELYGRHTGSGSLNLWVEGIDSPAADRFDAVIDAGAILLPRLFAVDATLRTTADLVVIEDAQHVDYLRLHTANANVLMDNTTPLHQPGADVQLYELDKAFQLRQEGLVSTTNAYVVHRRYTHQVLVPNFHAPHLDTPLEFQRSSGAGYSEQHLSAAFTEQRLGGLESLLFLGGEAPEGWELSWGATPAGERMHLDGDGSEGNATEEERNLGAMLW
ncbi:leukotoxin LktA family filamentous adhesin [Pseudoxanthomonas suwonensis]|uniref:Filamentous haemagglutinin FhaB/tRNA nuclease CdiA-like TPS domain-containing protein n=1 Tax=Pseudoxanthomonas suwonensis TaxID=314722 RepID=A0A0E3UNM8_9GAMM|nr:leukotoxin LktA family filamentous adhesin [Pseudoxanthomonas suwonensis]AKC87321.1 hypothetical protein WQ53_11710 [Pseudoxanthomonas suwonensis]